MIEWKRQEATHNHRGDAAVHLFCAKAMEAGLVVLMPLSDHLPFDVVIYHAGLFTRVQVKRAYRHNVNRSRWVVEFKQTKVSRGKTVGRALYDASTVDVVAGVIMDTGDVYCFPLCQLDGQRSICVVPGGDADLGRHGKRKVDGGRFLNTLAIGGAQVSLNALTRPDREEG